ncbi:DUF1698 domain-containing protein [bacterium]|nr:DUF1698 domain-containing protein [bacterium]
MTHDAYFDHSKTKLFEQSLREHFNYYKTTNLNVINPQEFRFFIESKLEMINSASEGYAEDEIDRQRDLSVKFHWGHNHDFGDFYLSGKMGDRHINLIANFCTFFPLSIEDFREKDVFDIGCWTGGTTLLLRALGSRVVAIEEVKKYAEMISFLVNSFGIEEDIEVISSSLYSCNTEEFYDRFDIIFFPGVIYHLSDPLIALRILYNACRLGGVILVETAGLNSEEPYCRFDGSNIYHSGEKLKLNRSGWNWFIPSPLALYRMLKEAGFDEVKTLYFAGRVYGYAKKTSQIGICRAGLSVPDIK